ncbi:MAG TPA: disulfide bond formation protein B [Vitreimonas sp.]|uniref:disulfide bond formation protein B n=1 Tax=Vitreimonas sp. TaxID=3069702 RepID=UPI002D6B20BD|nr:disulfide bond formation protein B [Vitreimonas sp.]HYD87528.1 disulfide bond formation protein B [Vitreimonas sp.]
MSSISRLRPIWPLLMALASGGMLAAAHAFQRLGGLAPCPLCLDQRNWHWAVVGVGLVGFIANRISPRVARISALVVGLVLLGSAAQAMYHVAVEQHWVVAYCDARIDMNDIRPMDFEGAVTAPACDEIAWQMFGISMAGYNAITSLLLALASLAVALSPERKS